MGEGAGISAQSLRLVESRIYSFNPFPHYARGSGRPSDEADCQRMLSRYVGGAELDGVWHNRHPRYAFGARKGNTAAWHHCVRPLVFRDLLSRDVPHKEESLDCYSRVLPHWSLLLPCGCGIVGCLASLIKRSPRGLRADGMCGGQMFE